MRKLYTLAIALMLTVSLSAQRVDQSFDFNHMYQHVQPGENEASLQAGQQELELYQLRNAQRGGGSVIFYEDFDNGFAGNNGYGEWTVEDTGGGNIWMEATSNSPAGEFSTNIAALASETASNGWVIFDCDLFNTPIASGVDDVEGWITSPSIDMSDMESVIVEWQHYFRYCCFPFPPLFLEVSNDGGDSWTSFPAHGNFIPAANSLSANPAITAVDVSCTAAGESDVRIRFAYRQNPTTGSGYSHYHWGIDDVQIYENVVENDLSAVQVAVGDLVSFLEYSRIPLDQALNADDDGLLVGLIYRNNGFGDHPEVTVTFDVLDEAESVLASITTNPFEVLSAANSPVCPANESDTLYISTGWTPTSIGTYTVRATISSTLEEVNEENNVLSKNITFTEDELGRDLGNWNQQRRPRENPDIPGLYDPYGEGFFLHVPYSGSTAYGALVAFGPNSDPETEFELRMYTLAGAPLNDAPFEPSFYEITPEFVPNSADNAFFTYFPFEDPVQLAPANPNSLNPATFYFLGVVNDFESPGELTFMANANYNTDNGTGSYQRAGSGDFVWFTSQTHTPAIRLVTSPRVAIDELADMNGIDLKQNFPNPAVDNTTIEFYLVNAKPVTFEIFDMHGRIIEVLDLGTLPGGEHRFVLNVSELSTGLYYYTMVADGVRITRKMMVTKQ